MNNPTKEQIEIAINTTKDPEDIKLWLKHFNKELETIKQRNNIKKNIGELVYTKNMSLKIIDTEEYVGSNGKTTTFYWVTPTKLLNRFIEFLKYKWSSITDTTYINKRIFINPVLLGTDIFLSKKDAETAYLLEHSICFLSELGEYYE